LSEPTHDLSALRINRDEPSPGSKRALRISVTLAAVAALFLAIVLYWKGFGTRREVTVALAQVVGGVGGALAGLTANGYVVAQTKASVSSKITGRLAYLGVSEGSVVRRGEILARLENDDYRAIVEQVEAEVLRARAALREAEAQRDQLGRDLTRAEDLLSRGLASDQEVEDLTARLAAADARVGVQEAQVQAAGASVGVARANLENTYIRAPFNGTVLRKDAEVGEVVAPVATGGGLTRGAVVTMADLQTLEVEVDVNEAYIGRLGSQQPCRIILDAYPDDRYQGAIRQIVPTADRQRATVLVKVSILNADSRILPEMAARVEFLEDRPEPGDVPPQPRVLVPAEAVQDEAGQAVVWVVQDDRVARRVVEAGPVSGGRREIRSGLSGGERVVVVGADELEEGTRVRVSSGTGPR
jgi:RND family efflux transporter MFP subunit